MELARWFSSGSYCLSSLPPSSPHLYLYLPPVFSPVIRITLSSKLNKYTRSLLLSFLTLPLLLSPFISPPPLLSYLSFFFCLFLLLSVCLRQLYASQPLTKGPFLFGSKYPLPPPPVIPLGLLQRTQRSPSLAGYIEWNLIRRCLRHQQMQRSLTCSAKEHRKKHINDITLFGYKVNNFICQMIT